MTAPWPAPNEIDDGALLRHAAGGDEDAFALLYHRHRSLVHRVCVAHGPRGMADDLTSETFATLFQHAERLWDRDRLAPWLATVARNTAISALRRPVVHRESSMAEVPARFAQADHAESVTTRIDVDALLSHVNGSDAAMLRAHYMDGRPLAEIAREFGTSVGAIKVRIHRARGRARRTAFARSLRGVVPVQVLTWRTQVADVLRADVSTVAMVLAPVAVVAAIAGGIAGSDIAISERASSPEGAVTSTLTHRRPGSASPAATQSAPVDHQREASTIQPPSGQRVDDPPRGAPDDGRPDVIDVPRVYLSSEPPAQEPDSTVGIAGLEVETTSPPGVSDATREQACDVVAVAPDPVSCHNER
ncbi:RNA polymerase sigma factor [Euzebya rosea]|uniref:RNA polymerase sigma factor n=1 Tax=Euzebya rosea TaxID=2052804 RepID=UPI0014736BEF|nr:sigma-70 family RNA polymerase sigma factor [Euzebya rosea]